MNNINIEVLYKLLINDLKITDDNLKIYGYSEEEIDLLLENNIIERLKVGEYKLVLVDKFRQYGLSLLRNGKKYEADKCFKKCYELAPNSRNIRMQYLLLLLKKRDYCGIISVIDNINFDDNTNSTKDVVTYNLFLYLLSYLTELPDIYKEKVANMGEEELLMPISKVNIVNNNIIRAVIDSKFKFAYRQINDLIASRMEYSPKFEFIKELIRQVVGVENTFKENLFNLAKNGQYKEIVLSLEKRKEIRYLSIIEAYILIIAENMVDILETRRIPVVTIGSTDDMYQALICKNFEVALSLNNEFIQKTRKNKEEDIINLLLEKLNEFILKIKLEGEMKQIDSLQYDDYNVDIKEAMDMAYYLKEENFSLEYAIKKIGLNKELTLLIKLIYARDYYIEGRYLEGDILLKEVDNSFYKTSKVLEFLDEVKKYRINNNQNLNLKLIRS